jgi:hypothetical protein
MTVLELRSVFAVEKDHVYILKTMLLYINSFSSESNGAAPDLCGKRKDYETIQYPYMSTEPTVLKIM